MTPTLKFRVSEIAKRFLVRLLHQRESIHAAVAAVKEGKFASLDDVYQATHQIAGTAATFGYDDVSRKAHAINRLISSFEIDPGKWELARLELLLVEFDDAVFRATRPSSDSRASAVQRESGLTR